LERSLRTKAHQAFVPADLHDSIMTGIRNRGAKIDSRQDSASARWLRWMPAPALAASVIVGLVYYRSNTPPEPTPTSMALATLELGETMAQSLPVAMKPLSEELDRVQQDLDQTAKFLAASLP
jgi:hypothetical protein